MGWVEGRVTEHRCNVEPVQCVLGGSSHHEAVQGVSLPIQASVYSGVIDANDPVTRGTRCKSKEK